MAWGHIPIPRKDYHSAERHAATQTYRHYTRGQIAAGALGPGTAAAQASAHQWFSHLTWQNHRDAVVAQHKAERAKREEAHARRLVEHRLRIAAWQQEIARHRLGDLSDPLSALLGNTALAKGLSGPERHASFAAALRFVTANAKALWGTAGEHYGGKMPKTAIGTYPDALGQVFPGAKGTARLSRDLAEAAAHGNPHNRALLSKVLLHEWAHTRQSPQIWHSGQRTREGGAELYARMVAHDIGLNDVDHAYDPYVKWISRRDPTRKWTRRIQFGQ